MARVSSKPCVSPKAADFIRCPSSALDKRDKLCAEKEVFNISVRDKVSRITSADKSVASNQAVARDIPAQDQKGSTLNPSPRRCRPRPNVPVTIKPAFPHHSSCAMFSNNIARGPCTCASWSSNSKSSFKKENKQELPPVAPKPLRPGMKSSPSSPTRMSPISPTNRTASSKSTPTRLSPILKSSSLKNSPYSSRNSNYDAGGDGVNQRKKMIDSDCCLPDLYVQPGSTFAYFWTCIVAIAVFYNMFTAVMRLAFQEMQDARLQKTFQFLDLVSDVIYLLDVGIQARTGFYKDGYVVNSIPETVIHYRQQPRFILDVISIAPVYQCLWGSILSTPVMRFIRFLKYHSIRRFFEMSAKRTTTPILLSAFRIGFHLSIVLHWTACVYYLISQYEGFGTNNWVYPNVTNKQLSTFRRKYIQSLYWSAMTLTSIGGRPWPQTDLEYLFSGFTLLLGLSIFATIVGHMLDVIRNVDANQRVFHERMERIKHYLDQRHVPARLQNKVRQWVEYSRDSMNNITEESILQLLPQNLRSEVTIHFRMGFLKKVRLLSECEDQLMKELVLQMKTIVYNPEQYVCRMGDLGSDLYMVYQGKVEIVGPDLRTGKMKVKMTMHPGHYFGEISILDMNQFHSKRLADARSVGFSQLLCLSRSDFLSVLSKYPETKQMLENKMMRKMEHSKWLSTPIPPSPVIPHARSPSEEGLSKLYEAKEKLESLKQALRELKSIKTKLALPQSTILTPELLIEKMKADEKSSTVLNSDSIKLKHADEDKKLRPEECAFAKQDNTSRLQETSIPNKDLSPKLEKSSKIISVSARNRRHLSPSTRKQDLSPPDILADQTGGGDGDETVTNIQTKSDVLPNQDVQEDTVPTSNSNTSSGTAYISIQCSPPANNALQPTGTARPVAEMVPSEKNSQRNSSESIKQSVTIDLTISTPSGSVLVSEDVEQSLTLTPSVVVESEEVSSDIPTSSTSNTSASGGRGHSPKPARPRPRYPSRKGSSPNAIQDSAYGDDNMKSLPLKNKNDIFDESPSKNSQSKERKELSPTIDAKSTELETNPLFQLKSSVWKEKDKCDDWSLLSSSSNSTEGFSDQSDEIKDNQTLIPAHRVRGQCNIKVERKASNSAQQSKPNVIKRRKINDTQLSILMEKRRQVNDKAENIVERLPIKWDPKNNGKRSCTPPKTLTSGHNADHSHSASSVVDSVSYGKAKQIVSEKIKPVDSKETKNSAKVDFSNLPPALDKHFERLANLDQGLNEPLDYEHKSESKDKIRQEDKRKRTESEHDVYKTNGNLESKDKQNVNATQPNTNEDKNYPVSILKKTKTEVQAVESNVDPEIFFQGFGAKRSNKNVPPADGAEILLRIKDSLKSHNMDGKRKTNVEGASDGDKTGLLGNQSVDSKKQREYKSEPEERADADNMKCLRQAAVEDMSEDSPVDGCCDQQYFSSRYHRMSAIQKELDILETELDKVREADEHKLDSNVDIDEICLTNSMMEPISETELWEEPNPDPQVASGSITSPRTIKKLRRKNLTKRLSYVSSSSAKENKTEEEVTTEMNKATVKIREDLNVSDDPQDGCPSVLPQPQANTTEDLKEGCSTQPQQPDTEAELANIENVGISADKDKVEVNQICDRNTNRKCANSTLYPQLSFHEKIRLAAKRLGQANDSDSSDNSSHVNSQGSPVLTGEIASSHTERSSPQIIYSADKMP